VSLPALQRQWCTYTPSFLPSTIFVFIGSDKARPVNPSLTRDGFILHRFFNKFTLPRPSSSIRLITFPIQSSSSALPFSDFDLTSHPTTRHLLIFFLHVADPAFDARKDRWFRQRRSIWWKIESSTASKIPVTITLWPYSWGWFHTNGLPWRHLLW